MCDFRSSLIDIPESPEICERSEKGTRVFVQSSVVTVAEQVCGSEEKEDKRPVRKADQDKGFCYHDCYLLGENCCLIVFWNFVAV